MSARIYLDHNATSPPLSMAVRAANEAFRWWGNPSANYLEGREAFQLVRDSASAMLDLVGSDPGGRIVWCGSATEALATAIVGFAALAEPADTWVVSSLVEHAAVLRTIKDRFDPERVRYVAVDGNGQIDVDDLQHALDSLKVSVVALQAANPETGVIQDYDGIASVCRSAGVPLVLDAVQLPGRTPFNMAHIGPTAAVFSPHKFGAIKGVGALWLAPNARIDPLYSGGRQQAGFRPGTEPVPAIAAAGGAAREVGIRTHVPQSLRALQRAIEGILTREVDAVIWGRDAPRLPNTSSVWLALPAADLVRELDRVGVAVSSASACGLGGKPSHVLQAMGLGPEASQTIRISTGPEIGLSTARDAAGRIVDVVRRLRA